jgi:DNA primase
MAWSQETLNAILEQVNLPALISRTVTLVKKGHYWLGLCPFHTEKTPSFTVHEKKHFYHCFGCKASGNAFQWVMTSDNMRFPEAVEYVACQAGYVLPKKNQYHQRYEQLSHVIKIFHQNLSHMIQTFLKSPHHAALYCEKRGITDAICQQFLIGYAVPHQQASFKMYDDCLILPIRNIYGVTEGLSAHAMMGQTPKYRHSPDSLYFKKRHALYGLYETRLALPKHTFLILVEGYFDAITLIQHGWPAAAIMGTAMSVAQWTLAFRYTSNVILCLDGDSAGRTAQEQLALQALPYLYDNNTVHMLFLPDNEDPDSYITTAGKDAFQALLDRAVPLSQHLLALLHKLPAHTLEQKSIILNTMNRWLNIIPDGAFKTLLTTERARITGVTLSRIKPITHQPKLPALDPVMLLMMSILHQPYKILHHVLPTFDFPGKSELHVLWNIVHHQPNCDTSMLLVELQHHAVYNTLRQHILTVPHAEDAFEKRWFIFLKYVLRITMNTIVADVHLLNHVQKIRLMHCMRVLYTLKTIDELNDVLVEFYRFLEK